MMDYTIFLPTPLDEIDAIYDNIDVCITTKDGTKYTVVFVTPDGLKQMMKNDNSSFIEPVTPFAIVDTINEKNIRLVIDRLMAPENNYFLQVYGGDYNEI